MRWLVGDFVDAERLLFLLKTAPSIVDAPGASPLAVRDAEVKFSALFVGLCCGALVNASNVYLGLKTGWTFTANLFGVSGELTHWTYHQRLTKL